MTISVEMVAMFVLFTMATVGQQLQLITECVIFYSNMCLSLFGIFTCRLQICYHRCQ